MALASALALRKLAGLSVSDLARLLVARSFQYAPKFFKYCVYLLFLAQIRSWPLVWHFVVWRPVFAIRGQYYYHCLKYMFSPAAVRRQKNLEWLEGLSNVGMNPFDLKVIYRTWAGPDDCDFNLHLSNSSYPKRLDSARFKFALACCPTVFRVGGWMALGATHFTFLREIPMFSSYEMRTNIMSWDHKWIYVVTRYVTKAKKGKGKGKHVQNGHTNGNALPPLPAPDAPPHPSLHTASGVLNGTSTPYPPSSGTSSPPSLSTNGTSNGNGTTAAIAAQFIDRPEPDGATIHCLAISEVCCKIGRITVPPALVFAMDGFSVPPPTSSTPTNTSQPQAYSHAHPPPHWETVRALRGDTHVSLDSPNRGGLRALRDFYTKGWRDVPEDARWWDSALGGEVEERRVRALGCMQALRKGVEEARSM